MLLIHSSHPPCLLLRWAPVRLVLLLLWGMILGLQAGISHAGEVIAAPQVLRVLAWPGYADADVVQRFEQRMGAHVELTLVSSDDVLWQKISKDRGANFDVFATNTAELQRYIDQSLALPVAPEAIPNTRHQLPRFNNLKSVAGITRQGAVYGIPYAYAEMGLIYDRNQISEAPDSITALWDARYRGKVLAYNGASHNFSLAAQVLGKPSPFKLVTDDWPQAVASLVALRRNVLGFYTLPEESVELFQRHRAALLFANYGTQQLQLLREAGANVGYVIPREGALAWLDCWVIARGVKNPALASAWINYTLERDVSQLLASRHGLSSTVATGADAQSRLLWLEAVEDVERRSRLWERIMSGDSVGKVLAP